MEIDGGPFTVMLSCLELLPNVLDAVTVKVTAPSVVGGPVITPVDGFKFIPLGRAPLVTDQVIGAVPEAARVWE